MSVVWKEAGKVVKTATQRIGSAQDMDLKACREGQDDTNRTILLGSGNEQAVAQWLMGRDCKHVNGSEIYPRDDWLRAGQGSNRTEVKTAKNLRKEKISG